MDPLEPQQSTPGPETPPASQNGAAAPQQAAEAQPGETAELEALRLARTAHAIAGGLIARVDQIETRVVRVDRQVLMLIGMVALVSWSVKSLAGKVAADAAAQAA